MEPDRNAWLAAGGDADRLALLETVGEVAAFGAGGERILAGIHPSHPDIGTLSGWTGGAEVLAAAQSWLAGRGCRVARGPLELCSWFEHRANLGPFDEPPFAFEPTAPAEPWVNAGYRAVHTSSVALAEHDGMINAATDRMASLSASGWAVRALPLDMGEGRASEVQFREAVRVLHTIASAAVVDSFGFAPISLEAYQSLMEPQRKVVDPRLVLIANAPNGKPAGIVFAVPDFAQPKRGWFVVTTLAVDPTYRQAGIGAWLVAGVHRAARRAGYKAGVHWLPDGRADLGRHGARLLRRYAVYEKGL
jgi:GNAT superfamily N-acetyltransferase